MLRTFKRVRNCDLYNYPHTHSLTRLGEVCDVAAANYHKGVPQQIQKFNISPSFRTSLVLGELVYFSQAALTSVVALLFLATLDQASSGSIAYSLIVVALDLVISLVWFRLGRDVKSSRFVYAGGLGMTVAVLLAVITIAHPVLSDSAILTAITGTAGLVYIAYVVFQVRAFFDATKATQIKVFKYAGVIFIVGIIATTLSGVVAVGLAATYSTGGQVSACAPSSTDSYCSLFNEVNRIAFGIGHIWAGLTSLLAGLGFHKLTKTIG